MPGAEHSIATHRVPLFLHSLRVELPLRPSREGIQTILMSLGGVMRHKYSYIVGLDQRDSKVT